VNAYQGASGFDSKSTAQPAAPGAGNNYQFTPQGMAAQKMPDGKPSLMDILKQVAQVALPIAEKVVAGALTSGVGALA
jgi:hypothetical protein